ncbi:PPR containing protein [Parasponia andersonii]|uniref:PPR containing protein n=1 Tax=Parasponia andersonii TaxID=3476 RepID=A0A2P5BDP6_PARAD|nr:PPR containing protein [Parasponia andersonii]
MATSIHPHQTSFLKFPLTKPKPRAPISSYVPIRCGPRDNRGPLFKGRVLSIEAIQAVQTLKRAQRSDPTSFTATVSKTLSRLIKADLLAALNELLRQDQCALALQVFSAFRSEYQPELSLYAAMVQALSRNGMAEDIDRLICDLEEGGGVGWDDKGLITLVRAVIASGRRESTVRIYGMLKRNGVGSSGGFQADDYMVGALSKGLRRLGEVGLADEIGRVFGRFYEGSFDKLTV